VPLLDIEKVIKKEGLNSRFKLVHIAGLRARELNSPKEGTLPRQNEEHSKVTTTALDELIRNQVEFVKIETEEDINEKVDE
jgi:DNA-directed RNA polymerase subunit omega